MTARRTCETPLRPPPIRVMAEQGVVVAMAGEIHGADDVRKTHTHAHATFQSPNAGRAGPRRRRPRHPASASLAGSAGAHSGAGRPAGADPRRRAGRATFPAGSRAPAGLVVAAAGGGNTPPAYLELARPLIDGGIAGGAHHALPVRPRACRATRSPAAARSGGRPAPSSPARSTPSRHGCWLRSASGQAHRSRSWHRFARRSAEVASGNS